MQAETRRSFGGHAPEATMSTVCSRADGGGALGRMGLRPASAFATSMCSGADPLPGLRGKGAFARGRGGDRLGRTAVVREGAGLAAASRESSSLRYLRGVVALLSEQQHAEITRERHCILRRLRHRRWALSRAAPHVSAWPRCSSPAPEQDAVLDPRPTPRGRRTPHPAGEAGRDARGSRRSTRPRG